MKKIGRKIYKKEEMKTYLKTNKVIESTQLKREIYHFRSGMTEVKINYKQKFRNNLFCMKQFSMLLNVQKFKQIKKKSMLKKY